MALNRMTNEEMVSLTRTLVEPGHVDRKTLETLPELAAFMPRLEGAHLGLLTMQRQVEHVRVTSIAMEQKRKDQRHDTLARGIWHGLEAYEHLARDEARAAALAETQAVLFSDGLRVVQYSYRETAGYAQLLASRLEPRHRDLLASLPWDQGTMLDLVNEWMAVARHLGDLENERTRQVPDPARHGTVTQARMRWACFRVCCRTGRKCSAVTVTPRRKRSGAAHDRSRPGAGAAHSAHDLLRSARAVLRPRSRPIPEPTPAR